MKVVSSLKRETSWTNSCGRLYRCFHYVSSRLKEIHYWCFASTLQFSNSRTSALHDCWDFPRVTRNVPTAGSHPNSFRSLNFNVWLPIQIHLKCYICFKTGDRVLKSKWEIHIVNNKQTCVSMCLLKCDKAPACKMCFMWCCMSKFHIWCLKS